MLGKKLGEVRRCCRRCEVKKTKCVHLTEEEAAALLVEVTLKRASKKTRGVKRARSQVRNTTRNTTRAGDALTDADAEGEDDAARKSNLITRSLFLKHFFIEESLAIGPAVDPDDVVPDDVVPPEIGKSSNFAIVIALMSFISVPSTHHVDNDVNIDFTVEHPAPDSPAHVVREVAPEPPAPQPSNLDILQTINAMRQDFAGLLQVSRDHVDVVRREVNTRVDEVEDRLTARIAAMEKKMREIDLETASNTVNMGHMANAMRIMAQPAGISAVGPVAGPSF